jgi:hypothetical protein
MVSAMASNLEHFTPNINTKDYYILSVNRYNFWDKGISWCNQVAFPSSGNNLRFFRVLEVTSITPECRVPQSITFIEPVILEM